MCDTRILANDEERGTRVGSLLGTRKSFEVSLSNEPGEHVPICSRTPTVTYDEDFGICETIYRAGAQGATLNFSISARRQPWCRTVVRQGASTNYYYSYNTCVFVLPPVLLYRKVFEQIYRQSGLYCFDFTSKCPGSVEHMMWQS